MWVIDSTDTFDEWLNKLDDTDQARVLSAILALSARGPKLPRPYADTVYGRATTI